MRPGLAGSWEDVLHDVGVARFYVTAAKLRHALGDRAADALRLHRAIGVVYRPETERRSHYYHARLADQFDVVIHVDETHAVRPLDRTPIAPPAGGGPDLPETFPTGL